MIRISVLILEKQRDQLRELAEKTGDAYSSHIRRAIKEYLERELKNENIKE